MKSDKLCECGCGQFTNLAKRARKTFGVTKGRPGRFLPGHAAHHARAVMIAKPRSTRKESGAYQSWRAMRDRCTQPSHRQWKDYGGRGINLCERWRSFDNFHADMGERPPGHTIERVRNSGNYEPGNCIWLPRAKQMDNTRRNVRLTLNGKTQHVAAWARELGISQYTIYERLKRGRSVEEALHHGKLAGFGS